MPLQKKFLQQYAFCNPLRRFAALCFDFFGGMIFLLLGPSSRRFDPSKIKRLLAVRLDHLGDVLMTRPALAALHQQFPNAQIDLLVSKEIAPLFEDAREVREVIGIEQHWFQKNPAKPPAWKLMPAILSQIRKRNYDLAIDFRGDLRNIALLFQAGIPERLGYGITGGGFLLTRSVPYRWDLHQALVNLELLKGIGIAPEIHDAPIAYSGTRKWKFWNTIGKSFDGENKTRIVVHAGAGYASKRWPAKRFAELIERLSNRGNAQILLIGTEQEKALLEIKEEDKIIDLRGKTEIADLPLLLDSCHLFIGNDSGPAHLAAAQGINVIVIFSGTNDAEIWKPWGSRVHLIKHQVPCSPCESQECPLKHHDCMEKISVDDVFERQRQILG